MYSIHIYNTSGAMLHLLTWGVVSWYHPSCERGEHCFESIQQLRLFVDETTPNVRRWDHPSCERGEHCFESTQQLRLFVVKTTPHVRSETTPHVREGSVALKVPNNFTCLWMGPPLIWEGEHCSESMQQLPLFADEREEKISNNFACL